MKIERTKRGARIRDDDVILSEILAKPGATHSLFDLLAAAVAEFGRGPRIAMLGFAGGGMVAPLRAMGCDHPLQCVDISDEAEPIFRELSSTWAGEVLLDIEDAESWLRKKRSKFDVIIEDLSVPSPIGTVKPYVSFDVMPTMIHSRLTGSGIAITNLLPLPGTSWEAIEARISAPYRCAFSVQLDEYENHVLITGEDLPDARTLGVRLRRVLRELGSDMLRQMRVRTLRYG